MAKKPSPDARRRLDARTKADRLTKKAPAKPAKAVSVRTGKTSAAKPVLDPVVKLEPTVFDPNAYKFVLTPPAPSFEPPAYEYLGELPDAYGTRQLYLVARDPYFLFAYWDLTDGQFTDLRHRASDGIVFLQLYLENGEMIQQIQLTGGTRNWYIHANRPNTTFYARLGVYHDGHFEAVSRSANVTSPPDSVSWKTHARFVTVPFNFTFRQLLDLIRAHMRPGEELVDALARLQEEGFVFPFDTHRMKLKNGSADGVYDYLGEEVYRRIRVGSFDMVETLRRRFEQSTNTSSGQWGLGSSMSSPFGASFGAGKRGFFMHVNAELILYGGTDPKAKVRINGENLKLRDDGTFTFHFNLPDGQYHIPIEATAPDGLETRSALLSFLRMSEYAGEVTATPQTPRPEPLGKSA